MKIIFLLFISSFCFYANAHAAAAKSTCDQVFEIKVDIENLISSLASLQMKLDIEKVNGTSSMAINHLQRGFEAKFREIVQWTGGTPEAETNLQSRIHKKIQELQSEKVVEEIKVAEARQLEQELLPSNYDGSHLILHRVQAGSFERFVGKKKQSVKITTDFEMAATPTSNHIWSFVLDAAREHLKLTNSEQEKIELMDDFSNLTTQHRPASSAYWQVNLWISLLNRVGKSQPDLIKTIISSHTNQSIYRLPTEAERDFVGSNRGRNKTDVFFDIKKSDFHKFFHDPKKDQMAGEADVASLMPVNLDGKPFYDLFGNMFEYTKDWWSDQPKGGTDPYGADRPSKEKYVVYKGSYRAEGTGNLSQKISFRGKISNTEMDPYITFRLVREVKP